MRITIAAVGKVRNAPEQGLCDLYLERARGLSTRLGFSKVELSVVDTSRAGSVVARMEEEAERLLALGSSRPVHRVVLDENGRAMTSPDLAAHLARLRDSGLRDLMFLIGGPDGLSPALHGKIEDRLSFGAQTWPHLLVRVMLAEQLYRTFTILAGHPYHRGKAG